MNKGKKSETDKKGVNIGTKRTENSSQQKAHTHS